MQSETSIEIDRPIDEVFNLTIRNVEKWSNVVVEDEVLEEKPEMVGTTFRSVTEDYGRRDEFLGTVVEHEEPTRHTVELVGKSFDIRAEYGFEDLGDGRTKVSQVSTVKAKAIFFKLMFLFSFLMKKSSCDALHKEFQSLKAYCESQPAASE